MRLTGKYQDKKSYILTVLLAVVLLVINSKILFPAFPNILHGYLAAVIALNLVVAALLANATYYTSRVKIDELYVSIAFYLFVLISDYVLALLLLYLDHDLSYKMISLFLAIGRLSFVFGIVSLRWQKSVHWIYQKPVNMLMLSGAVFAIQLLAVYMLETQKVNLDTVLFLVNGLTLMLLVIVNYELVLGEHHENSYPLLFGFSTLLIAQLLITLANPDHGIQIQSEVIQAISLGFCFYHINRNNFLIPEREQLRLQRQFNLYSMNLKKIIDKKTYQVREANQKFIDELEYAKQIQQSLLPNPNTTYRDVKFISEYFPCERLSGDFYDHYRLDDDNLALYLLDVSGHGLSAALLTMFSNNYLKSTDKNLQLTRGLKPDRTLHHFYEQFNKLNFPDEMHMVVFYATLNLNTKTLTYCSAGLNCSPIRFRKNGKVEYLDKSEGFPICKLMDFIVPEFRSEKIKLVKGDRLLFYTDGLIDREKNSTFDLESLTAFIKNHKDDELNELNRKITGMINPMKESLNDDITYMLLEI